MSERKIEELFEVLNKKLDIPIEELKAEYESVLAEVKADPQFKEGVSEEVLENIARNRFTTRKTRELSSNAVPWEGTVFGIGDLIDTVANQKRLTDAAFKVDPMKTMKGWVYQNRLVLANKDGVPLYPDTPGNKKMNRVGKPLVEHSWLRTVLGVARPIDKKTRVAGPPQTFKMSLNGKAAIDVSKIPLNKKAKFLGLNKTKDEDRQVGEYRINSSAFTRFDEVELPDMPELEQLLPNVLGHYLSLGELDEFHSKNEENYLRWVITEGNVTMLNLEPNAKTGNMMMIITDESLMFSGDQTGVVCWIPTDRGIEIDFGVESRIFVVGKTTRGKARDPITQELTEAPGDVMINVYGIYAPEMFKVKATVEPVTKESLVPKESSEEDW